MNSQSPIANRQAEREFYTRVEFAEVMGYSLRTVDELIAAGEIDVHRFGRNVRIPVEAVRGFVTRYLVRGRSGAVQAPVELGPSQAEMWRKLFRPVVDELMRGRA